MQFRRLICFCGEKKREAAQVFLPPLLLPQNTPTMALLSILCVVVSLLLVMRVLMPFPLVKLILRIYVLIFYDDVTVD